MNSLVTNIITCNRCNGEYISTNFRKRKDRKGKIYTLKVCIFCERKQKAKAESKRYAKMTVQQKKIHHQKANASARTEKGKSTHRKWQKEKEQYDFMFKLKRRISTLIRSKFKKKDSSIIELLGYSVLDLRNHLESQFEPWMNFDNYGKYNKDTWDDKDSSTWTWQIDHIVPVSAFCIKEILDEEFRKCYALSNLRPLSSKENILKGNKIINS